MKSKPAAPGGGPLIKLGGGRQAWRWAGRGPGTRGGRRRGGYELALRGVLNGPTERAALTWRQAGPGGRLDSLPKPGRRLGMGSNSAVPAPNGERHIRGERRHGPAGRRWE